MTSPVDWTIPDTEDIVALFDYMEMKRHIKKPKLLKKPIHLQCTHCNDTINSSYSGEYVSCKCGTIGVDQTEYYTRMIGNDGDYLVVNNGEVEK